MSRSIVVGLCTLACALAATAALWPHGGGIRTEDHNRDGQPDVWRQYDGLGRLADVLVDTNFDGRSDVHEYYDRGALIRRESDRDFNDRVDLIQEFDATTRERARSVVDTDFDGTADLLVLFQGGKPVFSKWAPRGTPVVAHRLVASVRSDVAWPSRPDDQLARLQDPFRADLAIRGEPAGPEAAGSVDLTAFTGLAVSTPPASGPFAASAALSFNGPDAPSSAFVLSYSPRGPPVLDLLG